MYKGTWQIARRQDIFNLERDLDGDILPTRNLFDTKGIQHSEKQVERHNSNRW